MGAAASLQDDPMSASAPQSEQDPGASVHRILLDAGAVSLQRGKFEFLRLVNPGARVPRPRHRDIVESFALVTDLLCQADTHSYWLHRPRYLSELSELWTVHLRGSLVGFSGLRLLTVEGENILYVDTLNVRPKALFYRFGDYSLGTVFVHEIFISQYLRGRAPLPFAFRTQNPNVYKLARTILPRGVHPRLDGESGRDPTRAKRLAVGLTKRMAQGFEFDRKAFVIRGVLGRSLYATTSAALRTADPLLQRFWAENVFVKDGDALLIVAIPRAYEAAALALRYALTVMKDRARELAAGESPLGASLGFLREMRKRGREAWSVGK